MMIGIALYGRSFKNKGVTGIFRKSYEALT